MFGNNARPAADNVKWLDRRVGIPLGRSERARGYSVGKSSRRSIQLRIRTYVTAMSCKSFASKN